MQDFEKLGVFYLGKEYDLESKSVKDDLILYDSKDLVTHAVCVGMTGSGKTGLCVSLLEEAAIDGIPAIVVDPKGDLTNLLLTFPDLSPKDFLPWINQEDARKKNLSPEEFARAQAELWKKGLAEWGQDSARIKRLRDAADFCIFTPGSNAGVPVSILSSFAAPEKVIAEDTETLRERINTTVTSLLSLLGIEADPLQSREHILLSTILHAAWKQGQDMGIPELITAIQSPPFSRIGVFDIESFFPSNDRFGLAMKLNNMLAAPGFQSWLEGEPLNINKILYASNGKPRIAIFSIAHLNDAERMFFVSLLLNQLLGWMRSQSGTASLRSIFYMDEIFGYFPPVANPPSKAPLLTLLKQARAFGLGIVLATQNPVDLDYKGLSNTGTWFIGRLQTERDKERVLDGLEGASGSAGQRFDRQKTGQILAGLGSRVFLMNNVNEDAPVLFQTRWAMSYLRGPLTRNQIKELMEPVKGFQPEGAETAKAVSSAPISAAVTPALSGKPVLPPGISEYFLPVKGLQQAGAVLLYEPMLLGSASIYFANAKVGIAAEKSLSLLADFSGRPDVSFWDEASEVGLTEKELEKLPENDAIFPALPREASLKGNYAEWGKALREWIARRFQLELFKSKSLRSVSQPGETERDFRIRLQQSAREKRDELVTRVREKYAPKISRLEERISRAEQTVEKEKGQAQQQKLQTAISIGATILSVLTGRKKMSYSTLGRATTAARGAGRTMKESRDIDKAAENVDELRKQLSEMQQVLQQEIEQVQTSIDPLKEELETYTITPKKTDISVNLVALTWVPHWQDEKGGITRAWN
ncbi:MAG: ATP-binding protein [Nitrospiraceae bacterium]|nr:MAG: ATP-binding protein [Nitrospiraceae bacterium]